MMEPVFHFIAGLAVGGIVGWICRWVAYELDEYGYPKPRSEKEGK